MDINNDIRICPYSGDEFVPKRSNQIFANNKYRIAYHNQKNNSKRKHLSTINKPLLKNYDILYNILKDEHEKLVHSEYLRGAGFSFCVFTNIFKDKSIDKLCYSVYDFYYFKFNDSHYKILKNG